MKSKKSTEAEILQNFTVKISRYTVQIIEHSQYIPNLGG